jgi:hypothetical protein
VDTTERGDVRGAKAEEIGGETERVTLLITLLGILSFIRCN